MDARAAWDWLTASGDFPFLSLYDLEYFLWYQLPAKFLTDLAHHRAVALAAADLFDDLGHADAAAVCRSPVTMQVLEEWDRSPDSGVRAMRRALEASGVEPPDTPWLRWGSAMGLTEAAIFNTAANWLERAIVDGEFMPGARGWKSAQVEVMKRYLHAPMESLDGRTPLAAVVEERQGAWAQRPGRPYWGALVGDVRHLIRELPAPPADAASHLRPALRILEIAAEGPRLTLAGYLPPARVRELRTGTDWWPLDGQPRSEADLPQLLHLREFLRQARLIRKSNGRLALTPSGRRALTEAALAWQDVTRALAQGSDFKAALRESLLLQLLQGESLREQAVSALVPVLVEAGWRPGDGGDLTAKMVSFKLWEAIHPMDLLGMIESFGDWQERKLRLTPFGRVSARAVLWHRSASPREL